MNAPTTLAELTAVAAHGAQGAELPHESAHLHVTGEACYTDDIPELRGTLYAALVTSPVAHGANFLNQLVNIALYNSDNLPAGRYLKFP